MADIPQNEIVSKITQLLQDIQGLVRLEEQSQECLKQPVEEMLDSAPDTLNRLEARKTELMRNVDLHATELFDSRQRADGSSDAGVKDAQSRLMLALRVLQRLHQDNERILQLRLTLLSEDLRNVERSRRFLRATLQSVAV
jgi:hypothetical protein